MLILNFFRRQVKKVLQSPRIVVSLVMTNPHNGVELQDELRLALDLGLSLIGDAESYVPYTTGEAVNHNDYLVYNSPLDYLIQKGK